MNKESIKRHKLRTRRKIRVRKKLRGNSLKPRLCVVKTNRHIFLQLIDDEKGKTLGSASTLSKRFRTGENNKKSKSSGRALGKEIAGLAKELKILQVVFDRGRSKYHGILAEVAEGAKEAGLKI